MSVPVIVIGSGGHAAVVADALLASGAHVLGFTDANAVRHGETLCGLPVLGDDSILSRHQPSNVQLANGIGGTRNEGTRRHIQSRLSAAGWRFTSVRHPSAVVSTFARLAEGVQVLANGVVQVGAEIGEGVVVNTAAVVEHHGRIGAFTHIAPRALLCGDVVVSADCHIGAGAIVRQGVKIGPGTLVAAGAVVIRDHSGGGALVGMPARYTELGS